MRHAIGSPEAPSSVESFKEHHHAQTHSSRRHRRHRSGHWLCQHGRHPAPYRHRGRRGSAGTGAVVGAGVGALGTYIWSQNMERQKREMEQATRGTGIGVTQTADNQLMLNIPSDISFAVGRSDIQPNFAPVLDQFAAGLRNNPNTDVRIVGHTDNTGSDAINNPLSMDRAASTRSYLTGRGVDGRRIAIDGMGGRYPIATNEAADGRAGKS